MLKELWRHLKLIAGKNALSADSKFKIGPNTVRIAKQRLRVIHEQELLSGSAPNAGNGSRLNSTSAGSAEPRKMEHHLLTGKNLRSKKKVTYRHQCRTWDQRHQLFPPTSRGPLRRSSSVGHWPSSQLSMRWTQSVSCEQVTMLLLVRHRPGRKSGVGFPSLWVW